MSSGSLRINAGPLSATGSSFFLFFFFNEVVQVPLSCEYDHLNNYNSTLAAARFPSYRCQPRSTGVLVLILVFERGVSVRQIIGGVSFIIPRAFSLSVFGC